MTDHGTPSGEGGDLDAVGREAMAAQREALAKVGGADLDGCGEFLARPRYSGSQIGDHIAPSSESDSDYRTRLIARFDELYPSEPCTVDSIRTATGSQLDACGAKLELPRVRSSESDGYSLSGYIESDTDYRGRLLAKLARDSTPRTSPTDKLTFHAAWGVAKSRDDYHKPDWIRLEGIASIGCEDTFADWLNAARYAPGSLHVSELGANRAGATRYANRAQVHAPEPEQVLDVPMSFDGESVAQLLVAFGLSKADAAVAVRLASLPEAIDEAGRRADEAAQEAVDYTIEAKRLRALLAREVQDAKPSIIEAFARMVPGVQS